jgi:hypothetical protein
LYPVEADLADWTGALGGRRTLHHSSYVRLIRCRKVFRISLKTRHMYTTGMQVSNRIYMSRTVMMVKHEEEKAIQE